MMKKSAYIITKPLQYINATNIPDDSIKDCLLINNFQNTEGFSENIKKYSSRWNKVIVFKNRFVALLFILFKRNKYEKLFIDSDFGTLNRIILLFLYSISVYVYEEGFGNYRKTIRTRKTLRDRLLGKIDNFLGSKHIGSFYLTKGIYLYNHNAFLNLVSPINRKQLLQFKSNFQQHLTSLPEISILFPTHILKKIKEKDVLLYLTSWEVNQKYLEIIQNYPKHIKILKPHPHIKNKTGIERYFDITITNSLPAEILIAEIANNSNSLLIIHQGSSALLYIKNSEKIKEINIDSNTKYIQILEEIKSINY
jgi:hypothetical protein